MSMKFFLKILHYHYRIQIPYFPRLIIPGTFRPTKKAYATFSLNMVLLKKSELAVSHCPCSIICVISEHFSLLFLLFSI